MKHFETIGEYYKEFGHTPPKLNSFDVRPFEQYYEEEKVKKEYYAQEAFRVEFYGIGLLIQGTAEKHKGKRFDANVVFYSPYQVLSFDGVAANWKGFYIMFDQKFLDTCSFGKTFYTDFPFLRLDNVQPIKISEEEVQELLPIFEKIHVEFNSNRTDKLKLIEIYLNLILHHIKRYTVSMEITGTDNKNKAEVNLVSYFRSLLETHISMAGEKESFLSPSFYAEKLNIHQNYLAAVVKRITGKTSKQLIHEVLIIIAKSLLVQSSHSIKEISAQLGFEDPSHFNNLFKKHTSVTPAQYRRLETT